MRNGKTLLRRMGKLVVLAVVAVGVSGVLAGSAAAASAQKGADKAPSAMVIFPVTEKAEMAGKGMRPAVFNHFIHEKKVTACETCHHTGKNIACTTCHTVEGKADGKFVTLERAMHAENIAPRTEGTTPVSCVSCHTKNLQRTECAGCHNLVPQPQRSEAYCATCHDVTSAMTAEQFKQGSLGELSAADNLTLAEQTVAARKPVEPFVREQIPHVVTIDSIADKYAPTKFSHLRHVGFLQKRLADDKLSAAFHSAPTTVCGACHHNSPASATPPKCASCHSAKINPAHPQRPTLKAAYHLQCMGCHKSMNAPRPKNTSCTTCHKLRAK